MNFLDILVQNYFIVGRTPGVTELLFLLTIFFDFSIQFALLTIFIAILIYLVRNIKFSLLFILSLTLTSIIVYGLK